MEEAFGDLPLFGGEQAKMSKGRRKRGRKRRGRRKNKKGRVKQLKSKRLIKDLPIFNWYVNSDFEGENSDSYRNIVREFFRAKWQKGNLDWSEEELFGYVRQHYKIIPIACFRDFWCKARKSPKGKLNWVDYLERITERDWNDYSRLVRTKLMTGSERKRDLNDRL